MADSTVIHDAADIGQDKKHKDAAQKYDQLCGTYRDTVDVPSPEDRLPTVSMPKGPDPTPFSIGPMAPGGRE